MVLTATIFSPGAAPEDSVIVHLGGKYDWKRIALRAVVLDMILHLVGVAVTALYLLITFKQAVDNGTVNPIVVEFGIMLPTFLGQFLYGLFLTNFCRDVGIKIRKENSNGCWKMLCRRAGAAAVTFIIHLTAATFVLFRFPLSDDIFQTRFYLHFFKAMAIYMGLTTIGGAYLTATMLLCIRQFHHKEAFFQKIATMNIVGMNV